MTESLKQRGHQRRIGSAQAAAQSKPGLQWSSESGITEIVLPWKALSLSGILPGYVLRTEPSSFLLNLSSRRITQFFLSLDRRIGRLNTQNPCRGGNLSVIAILRQLRREDPRKLAREQA